MNISDSFAWNLMVWRWDYKKNVILKHAHRWQLRNSGYFYALHIKLPKNVLRLIILGTPWMERRVYSTATNIFPAGNFFMSHLNYTKFIVIFLNKFSYIKFLISLWYVNSFFRISIKESSVAKLGSVCRRVYRIFSHAYFHHRTIFDEFENETYLCRR